MLRSAFWTGIASGMMVGIGGTVYLSCENKVVGAVLFSVALLVICLLGFPTWSLASTNPAREREYASKRNYILM